MTRVSVYAGALAVLTAVAAMTLASILKPNWVSYSTTNYDPPYTVTYTHSLGLHEFCVASTEYGASPAHKSCRPWPGNDECSGDDHRSICSMWLSVGFLMNFAMVLELVAIVGLVVILAGGKQRRQSGWKVLGVLVGAVGVVLFAGMAIVAYLVDNDDHFIVPGWRLDTSWTLCTVNASISVVCAAGLAISAYVLPPEDGYEFLSDSSGV